MTLHDWYDALKDVLPGVLGYVAIGLAVWLADVVIRRWAR